MTKRKIQNIPAKQTLADFFPQPPAKDAFIENPDGAVMLESVKAAIAKTRNYENVSKRAPVFRRGKKAN